MTLSLGDIEKEDLVKALTELRAENLALKGANDRLITFANEVMDKWPGWRPCSKFNLGDMVDKIKGSGWSGKVVGFYRTDLTPEGYAVESEFHPGSVQIYPASALMVKKT